MQVFDSNGVLKVTFPPAVTITNINFSAGTTSNNLGSVVFSNSNNVSFGLNGSTITASIPVGGGASINFSAGTTSQNLASVVFSNSNNVSFGLNGSTITGSIATSLTNINLSAGTTSQNLSAFVFSNSNSVSFGLNGSTVTASFSVATSLTNINVSAGTTSNNLSAITFSNANGISFGLNASTVTASHNGITSQSNQQMTLFATSNTTQGTSGTSNASSLIFAGAGIASVGITNGSIVFSVPSGGGGADGGVFAGVSTMGNTAGSTGTVSTGNFVLVGSNGITLSQSTGAASSAATVTIQGYPIASYWERFGYNSSDNQNTSVLSNSSYLVAPIFVPYCISGSYIRLYGSVSAQSTTFATTANTTFSAGISYSWFYNIASLGAGASSQSLMSIFSSTVQFLHQISLQANANGSQFTVTHNITYPTEGGTSTFSTTEAKSTASFQISTQSLSLFTGFKYFDHPFAGSLAPREYWFMHGFSSSTATQGTNALTGCRFLFSTQVQPIINGPFGKLNVANNNSIGQNLGVGYVSSTNFPGNYGFSDISSTNAMKVAQMGIIRQA